MPGERSGQGWRAAVGAAALVGLAGFLSACGSTGAIFSDSPLDVFNSSSKATNANASADAAAAKTEVECPSVSVRSGAATLMIGSKPGQTEPSPIDLRYQGSIIRTARECQVNGGVMTMKVGIEGRVITGPAGGPGTVDVPLRIAVVQEGITPKTIVSKLAREQVTVTGAIDRVLFTHVDPEITFPLPQPLGLIDAYVVYVGFDPAGAAPAPKRPAPKRAAKPKQG